MPTINIRTSRFDGDTVGQDTPFEVVKIEGGLAVHIAHGYDNSENRIKPHTVTHIASGLNVARLENITLALEALRRLLPLADWTRGRDDLCNDKALAAAIYDAILPLLERGC